MMRLKSKLLSLNASKTTKVKVYSPRNCEELRIPFKADKTAKVVGKLASISPPKGIDASAPLVTGVLVQNDFKLSLMAPEDLREYAGLNTTTITCKQRLTLSAAGVDLVRWALEGTFGAVEELPEMRRIKDSKQDGDLDSEDEKMAEDADEEVAKLVAAYLVMGCVSVRYRTNGEVELEWEGNMLNDGIADSVMAVLFSVESSPAAVKRSSANSKHSHSHSPPESDDQIYAAQPDSKNPHAHISPADRLERLMWFLEAQFGADNVAPVEDPKLPPLPATSPSPKEEKKEEEDEEAVKEEEHTNGDENGTEAKAEDMDVDDKADEDEDEAKQQLQERQHKEIARLHKLGIPVPGVSIKVDKMIATVWLEDLDVECNNKVFADRVRAVVERAVEVTAPLWG
jgi:cleavage and polyadenylation specificity factor subunit 3